jgi:hypothetical protein
MLRVADDNGRTAEKKEKAGTSGVGLVDEREATRAAPSLACIAAGS